MLVAGRWRAASGFRGSAHRFHWARYRAHGEERDSHGHRSPGGSPTAALLRYGPTPAYGSAVDVVFSPNDGTTAQTQSVTLTGLLPATTYHCAFTATNAGGTSTTEDLAFTTPDTPIRVWKLTDLGDADAPLLGTPGRDGLTSLVKYGCVLPPGTSASTCCRSRDC